MCTECVRPNCNGQTHLTADAYLGCSQCGIELNDIIELVDNESQRSAEQCEICGHQYTAADWRNNHFLAHFYDQPAKVFLCIDCDESSPPAAAATIEPDPPLLAPLQQVSAAAHLRCAICDDLHFTSTRVLTKHNLDVHGITRRTQFACRHCSQVFESANKLSYHRLKQHPKPATTGDDHHFPCRICDVEIFTAKPERTQHENDVHRDRDTNLFPCPFCERTYANVSFLAIHMLKHTQKRAHVCDVCGKSFGRRTHMQYHRSTHTDRKPFECYMCDGAKTFKTEHSLNHHVARMHTVRPGYRCEQCARVFKDTSDLRRHRWTHGGYEKKFECAVCLKRFYERKAVRVHMRSHERGAGVTEVEVGDGVEVVDAAADTELRMEQEEE